MKLMVKDVSLDLLSVAGLGPEYGRTLVYFQGVGYAQAVRAFQYTLRKRQGTPLDFHDAGVYGVNNYLARGEWRMKVEPFTIQGVQLQLLTAYIPFGAWGYNGSRYFFVAPGSPGVWHDDLFHRWAENFTPYPIPENLSLESVLARRGYDEDAGVIVNQGKSAGGTTPWVVAIKPETLEEILKEASYAA